MTNDKSQDRWTLNMVLEATEGRLLGHEIEQPIGGISTDSRRLNPGDLFVALKGEHFDGHRFITQAITGGATAVVIALDRADRVDLGKLQIPVVGVTDTLRAFGDLARYWRRRYRIPAVAITGSNGKTTTKEMVATIVSRTRKVLKNQGTFNNLIGLPLTLFQLDRTHQAAVLELGMNQPGEIARLAEILRPDLGLITNIQPAHLAGLGTLEGIQAAKGELFAGMPSSATIVVNRDDPRVVALASTFSGRQVGYSATGNLAEVVLDRVVGMDANGSRFLLKLGRGTQEIQLPMIGRHQLNNAVAAAAVAWSLGIPGNTIAEALLSFQPVEKRMQVLTLPGDIWVINDSYNANPGSMIAALETLNHLKQEARAVAILGDMLELGDESAALHREVGRVVAKQGTDHLMAMGERAVDLLAGAVESGMSDECITRGNTHADLALQVHRFASSGDWVLVKGSRKMQMEKVVEHLIEIRKGSPGKEKGT
ncbi:MAG: UDP-N-acetylmuramoyl-tripeptide--D-alanyl-D-alanine ligase [Deltaproteobacteria bacterium]|nr:MAG: UDP-N-acetylmuramoyl-tripeptide--D-alanyl-D-alanine ligase [Deltaproteobacteria bacterium]